LLSNSPHPVEVFADIEHVETSGALGISPFEWIVNSNALGVAFLARDNNFRVSFLSRHAVRRLADGSLLGKRAQDLIDEPATSLADVAELRLDSLCDPSNYPASATAAIDGRHLELAMSSVTGSDGEYLGVMLTFKDITEAVQHEQDLLQFKDTMQEYALSGQTEADKTEEVAGSLTEAVSTVHGNGAQTAELIEQLSSLNNQTRMLSLNASIEAVRAGTAGSAFRVIADELGQLALRTKEVSGEVGTILNTIEADSGVAFECANTLTENITALIATQRAMEQEVQRRG
jgi:vacuolar-type H+-ATPase subunit I/STV1